MSKFCCESGGAAGVCSLWQGTCGRSCVAGWWVRCLRCVPIRSGLFSVELSIVGECKISFDHLDLSANDHGFSRCKHFLGAKKSTEHSKKKLNFVRAFSLALVAEAIRSRFLQRIKAQLLLLYVATHPHTCAMHKTTPTELCFFSLVREQVRQFKK